MMCVFVEFSSDRLNYNSLETDQTSPQGQRGWIEKCDSVKRKLLMRDLIIGIKAPSFHA